MKRILALLACWCLVGCSPPPSMKNLPSSLSLTHPTSAPVPSPCGAHLRAEPKIKRVLLNGQLSYIVPPKRFLCLLTRARIGRRCKGICQAQLTKLYDAAIKAGGVLLTVATRRERALVEQARAREKIMGLGAVSLALVLLGIGVVVGVMGSNYAKGK